MSENNTTTDSPSKKPLDPSYLRDAKSVTVHAKGVRVVFNDHTPPYEGDLEGLRNYVRRINRGRKAPVRIKDASIEGKRVGVFPAFTPTNLRQRKLLAERLSTPESQVDPKEVAGKVFTFGSAYRARELFLEAKEANCAGKLDRNWSFVAIQGGKSASKEQQDLPL